MDLCLCVEITIRPAMAIIAQFTKYLTVRHVENAERLLQTKSPTYLVRHGNGTIWHQVVTSVTCRDHQLS